MRIGIDCMTLHGQYSGVEQSVRALILSLAEASQRGGSAHEFVLYCGREVPEVGPLPPNFTWYPAAFPAEAKLRRVLWQQRELPRLARRDGLSVLHGPAYVTPIRCPVPTVVTIYDLMVFLHPEMCARHNRLHYRLVMPRCARRAARVAVPSEATRNAVIELLGVPEERTVKITLGIDPRFKPVEDEETLSEVRKRLDLPPRFVLFVGNLEPKKGVLTLLEAFARVKNQHGLPHVLVIAGSRGWLYDNIVKRAESPEMAPFVRLVGYVDASLLPALYTLADAFAFPSHYEGFGLPAIEAMACGTPVVCSDAGGLADFAPGAAKIVPPGDVGALAEALAEVLTDQSLRAELRLRGFERAAQFPPEAVGREMLAIYDAVARDQGSGIRDRGSVG